MLEGTATAQHVGRWTLLRALCTGEAYVISILLGAELDEPIALMVVRHSVLRKVYVHCRQQSVVKHARQRLQLTSGGKYMCAPTGPACTKSSHTSSSVICSRQDSVSPEHRVFTHACPHHEHRLLACAQHTAYLRVQVAGIDCRLLVAVLSMLANEVGTHASRDAATGRRHGDCLPDRPLAAEALSLWRSQESQFTCGLQRLFAAMFAHLSQPYTDQSVIRNVRLPRLTLSPPPGVYPPSFRKGARTP